MPTLDISAHSEPSAQRASTPILEVSNLCKRFKTQEFAVKEISFSVNSGEVIGLLGPNGAGKTTTIRMIISVLKPDGGSIKILGRDLATERSAVLQHVGFASTYTNLPLFLTVEENLDIHGRLYSMPSKLRRERIDQMLKKFRADQHRKKRVGQLSAGEKTRVMLAKAFLPRPSLALLDEPTASLDPDMAQEVREFVAEQRRDEGTAILFSSHNMAEVTELCDRVIFLKEGRVIAIDEPARLAAEAGSSILELTLIQGREQALEVLKAWGVSFREVGSALCVELREGLEGKLLVELTQRGVSYSKLSIHRPTLEDYFLMHSSPRGGVI